MACQLIKGNEILCRDSVGGVKTVYLANFENVQSITISSGVCTDITMAGTTKFFTFQLNKEDAQFDSKAISSIENSSVYFEETLNFTMAKMSASLMNQIKNLAQARLMAIVLDNNGIYWVSGATLGIDATEILASTGKAFGDGNKATLTFVGKEPSNTPSFTGTLSTITD